MQKIVTSIPAFPELRLASKLLKTAADSATTHISTILLLSLSPTNHGQHFQHDFQSFARLLNGMPQLSSLQARVGMDCASRLPEDISDFIPLLKQVIKFNETTATATALSKFALECGQFLGPAGQPVDASVMYQFFSQGFNDQRLVYRVRSLSVYTPYSLPGRFEFHKYSLLKQLDLSRSYSVSPGFCEQVPVSLRKLSFSSSHHPTSEQFRGLQLLEALSMFAETQTKEDFEGLQFLTHLKELHLSAPNASSVEHIALLPNLRILDIILHHISDLGYLSSCRKLSSLRMWCYELQSLNMLAGMPALKLLHIHSVKQPDGLPLQLSSNSLLEVLVVYNRKLSTADQHMITTAPALKCLELNNCTGGLPLASLTNLTAILCNNTEVKGQTLRTVRNSLPQLKVLQIHGCNDFPAHHTSFGKAFVASTPPKMWHKVYSLE